MNNEQNPPLGVAVDHDVGRLLLRCPKCRREMPVARADYDYPEAVRMEIVCPECDDGDFHEPFYYDAQGKQICRDPAETPNAELSGGGTPSA
jgi:hypothetical protein